MQKQGKPRQPPKLIAPARKKGDAKHLPFPNEAQLAALRAWYAGVNSRNAIDHYLADERISGASARGLLGQIRKRLQAIALEYRQIDLHAILAHPDQEREQSAKKVLRAIEVLRCRVLMPQPEPAISDAVGQWFSDRITRNLLAYKIHTLADLTVRIPRRKLWWKVVPGLGATSAKTIESFFAQHPTLTREAHALLERQMQPRVADFKRPGDPSKNTHLLAPWEHLGPLLTPVNLSGQQGAFRAPLTACTLNAHNDYEAVQTWLSLQDAPATLRSYRKEVERLILWAVLEQGRALSSLTMEDAIAYRTFLKNPAPRVRWIGPNRPRNSYEWKPFTGPLSPRSIAYALSVLTSLYRWLMDKGYMLANPFSGIKVRTSKQTQIIDTSHVFSQGEWCLVRAIADSLEYTYGWPVASAQRLRFILDFAYATGLRASELVGATLGQIRVDGHDDHWLHLVGKGHKSGKVALPPLARNALDQYLVARKLPTTKNHWNPKIPLIGSLEKSGQSTAESGAAGITTTRLRCVLQHFFKVAASSVQSENPALAKKISQATPHWMRHTHATHSLAKGVDLTTVRDNLRHASVATTSTYLHSDDVKRAKQLGDVFG